MYTVHQESGANQGTGTLAKEHFFAAVWAPGMQGWITFVNTTASCAHTNKTPMERVALQAVLVMPGLLLQKPHAKAALTRQDRVSAQINSIEFSLDLELDDNEELSAGYENNSAGYENNCQTLFADSLPLVKTHFMNNIFGMN